MARVAAGRGDIEAVQSHVLQALDITTRMGTDTPLTYPAATLGLLSLSQGQINEAIGQLEEVARLCGHGGVLDGWVVEYIPELIEAYVRAGRRSDAQRVLEPSDEQPRSSNRLGLMALAARCRGLVATDDTFEPYFSEAIELHQRTLAPFELARTRLALGDRLVACRPRRRCSVRTPFSSGGFPTARRKSVGTASESVAE
jgi:hypothetical protein